MGPEKQGGTWDELQLIEELRYNTLMRACDVLRESLPATFPKNFLDQLPGATITTATDLQWGEKKFEDWVIALSKCNHLDLRLGRHQLKGYLSKFGWQNMNDVESAFDELSVEWSAHVTMRTRIVTDDKLIDKPPISEVHISIDTK